MKYSMFLQTTLVVVAVACPGMSGSASDYLAWAGNLQQGWTEGVTDILSARSPWPVNTEDGITYVTYCYADSESWGNLWPLIDDAIALWAEAIGDAGDDTGHNLQIEEFDWEPDDNPKYCFLSKKGGKELQWNPILPRDTYVVRRNPQLEAAAYSTLGYFKDELDRWGRHYMDVNLQALKNEPEDDHVMIIAHEFGHAFGLMHEHQRDDRDDFVYFNCEKVKRYDEVKKQVEAEGKYTIEKVCKDAELAARYNFNALLFSKNPIKDQNGHRYIPIKGNYDVHSIMHYSSFLAVQPDKDKSQVLDYPMVKWNKPGDSKDDPTNDDVSIIAKNKWPSDGDKEAVKHIYPWKGPGNVEQAPSGSPKPVTQTTLATAYARLSGVYGWSVRI